MHYRINHKARDDLTDIYWFGATRFGTHQADTYYHHLIERFGEIAAAPLLWPAVDHIREGYRRSVFGSHSIYYRQGTDCIEIMRVLGRQDWDS